LASLVQYKKVVILVDEGSQSTAEVMASVLKKYNVGVLLGRKTKGWGTVERVFPLQTKFDDNESYSAFLVHTVTLREDGLPIEGNGVEPMISIDDKNWTNQLLEHFNSESLVSAVKEVWGN
jgi:C-terminal processing protease CtpA/Prc